MHVTTALALEADQLCVGYDGDLLVDRLTLSVGAGQSVALIGPSGSGKSTLLRCFLGLHRPSAGSLWVAGEATSRWNDAAWRRARLHQIGFVPQDADLLIDLTIGENVELPMLLAGASRRVAGARANELLDDLGLSGLAGRLPAAVSGGQRQRAALARAIANDPVLVVADEPTGSLDAAAASVVADLLFDRVARCGGALVVVTHDPAVASRADVVVDLGMR